MTQESPRGAAPQELTIATRGSELALAQARWVAARLEELGARARLLTLVARGDKELDKPLAQIGGKGLFTREIDDAVLEGRAELAVHSLKDLPALDEPELVLAAVPARESDRDVLALNPDLLPAALRQRLAEGDPAAGAEILRWLSGEDAEDGGWTVGCGSPRRQAQFRLFFPGVRLAEVRGNIQTRLRKLRENRWAGLVLAEAALRRLELDRTVLHLPLDFYPAPGQGALGVRARRGDGPTLALLARLDDPAARTRAEAERAFLREFAGGCHLPAGLRTRCADGEDGTLFLTAAYFPGGNRSPVRVELSGPAAQAAHLGAQAANRLREGAGNCP